jgi:hypothetical protein
VSLQRRQWRRLVRSWRGSADAPGGTGSRPLRGTPASPGRLRRRPEPASPVRLRS